MPLKTQVLPQRHLIIAFVEDHPKAMVVLRTARRRAQERGGKWRAVCVETPLQAAGGEDGYHEHMLRLMTLAQQMGAESTHIEAESMEAGLRKVLETEKERLALVVVGSSEADQRRFRLRRSSTQRILRLACQYGAVETVPLSGQPFGRITWPAQMLSTVRLRHLFYALLAVGIACIGAALLQYVLPPALFRINSQNVALLFMIACAFAAGRYGLVPGLLASVAGFFTANYFFIAPYRNIQIVNVTDALNMVLFLSAAVLISLFTSQTRGYAERVARRELSTQALFSLYRIAASAYTRQQALEKLQRKLTRMLGMEVAFFLPPVLSLERIEAAFPADLVLSEIDQQALENCWSEMKITGLASPFNPRAAWRFEPMMAQSGEIGVLGVHPPKNRRLDPWYGRLLTAIADQTASVLEHIELERSMEATRIWEEREKLRSMLLSSVSHDLKTPLAGIIGALSVIQSMGDRLPLERRADLMETALEEAHRLDSFITNILDMTRLESGKLEMRREFHDMGALVKHVTKRMQPRLRRHQITLHPMPAAVEVCMDVMMTEQVLQNLVDNACKYTPAGTGIEISGLAQERGFILEVRDHGAGLPPDKMEQVFDKYARLRKEDSQVAGTGLGLAICKAVMEAQGGWITAANHPQGGALFTLCLPEWRKTESIKHMA